MARAQRQLPRAVVNTNGGVSTMAKRTAALAVVLFTMFGATAGATEGLHWPCSKEMPVYAHELDALTRARTVVALRHLSDATGQHWYLAGDTPDDPAARAGSSGWPARIVAATSSLSAQWRGNTVIWANSTAFVAVDTTLNLYRLQGRAQTMKTLLHELAHMAGVEHHSEDPRSPLYTGTVDDPGTSYTAQDVADLAAVACVR